MIEPSDEMVRAFMRAAADTPVQVAGRELLNARAGVAAVLAVVERDRCLKPRGHVWHPLREPGPFAPVPDRERCGECDCPKAWHRSNGCQGDFGHCECSVRTDELAGGEEHCGKPIGEHMLCAREPGHGFPPCGFPVEGSGGELAS